MSAGQTNQAFLSCVHQTLACFRFDTLLHVLLKIGYTAALHIDIAPGNTFCEIIQQLHPKKRSNGQVLAADSLNYLIRMLPFADRVCHFAEVLEAADCRWPASSRGNMMLRTRCVQNASGTIQSMFGLLQISQTCVSPFKMQAVSHYSKPSMAATKPSESSPADACLRSAMLCRSA